MFGLEPMIKVNLNMVFWPFYSATLSISGMELDQYSGQNVDNLQLDTSGPVFCHSRLLPHHHINYHFLGSNGDILVSNCFVVICLLLVK